MDVIEPLRAHYAGDPYMSRKLEQYLADLPALLDGVHKEHQARIQERERVADLRNSFVRHFLDVHPFYYISSSDRFVAYMNNAYGHVTESELSQFIMCSIALDRSLAKFKFKLRNQVIQHIRRTRPILIATPSPVTEAQVVRAFTPTFLPLKPLARYFLAVVGDLLLGKRELVYFIDASFRPFISMVDQEVARVTNRSIADGFKFKYYDHEYLDCRVIPGEAPEHAMMRVNAYDLVAVAVAASRQHGSADVALLQTDDAALHRTVWRLRDNTPHSLLQAFRDEYTVAGGSSHFKDIYYLWATFLRRHSLPRVISKLNLKHMLTELGLYESKGDSCALSPRFSTVLIHFDHFWQKHLKPCPGNLGYDVAELVELHNGSCEANFAITEEECREWLQETHGDCLKGGEVVSVSCDLWDKSVDIENALEAFDALGCPGDAYNFYVDRTHRFNKMIVRRGYFETYLNRD